MRLLICGDRNWTDEIAIAAIICYLKPTVIIEGECRGADKLARKVAEELGYLVKDKTILPFPADWNRYGNGAGHIRNTQMLKEGKPELVGAFHSDIENSRGTANMLTQAEDNGISYFLIDKEVKGE